MTGPTRAELHIDGRRLSYLDFGGTGRPLLALHGHMSEGASFAGLAAGLAPGWRVIAPDQRGHGDSERAADYSRQGYLDDVLALLDHLGLDRIAILGHSLGAVNAYQFAARHPGRVEALVNAEGPVRLDPHGPNPLAFVLALRDQAPTRQALVEGLGEMAPFFEGALRENADGTWRLPFHPQDMVDSEDLVHGDHWDDWLACACPALLVRGTRGVIPADQARAMAERRPGTRLAELDTDHFVYTGDPAGFLRVVREFLASVAGPPGVRGDAPVSGAVG
ncbi:alpha/beta hydrolase [Streptosporangium sp. NPDC023825]|uniref:alpha/beta fold hydrolase n=1 Tax=Streptosporangium sp. NPDC023825 TaxID=3154909 RepID=UPI00341D42B3